MDRGVLLLVSGLFISYSVAQTSYPEQEECQDLVALTNHAKTVFNKLRGTLNCTPIKNCTGLSCSGKMLEKSFKGTVLIQGCQDPISLFVHWNNKHLLVKDGQKIHFWSKFHIIPTIKKKDGIVHITIKLCLTSTCTLPYKILDDQKVRVHCNDSESDVPWLKSTDFLPTKSDGSSTLFSGYASQDNYQRPSVTRTNYDAAISTPIVRHEENSEGKSLTKGAIAGIAIASLVVFSLFVAFVVILVKGKRLSSTPAYYNNIVTSDDTDPLYDDFEPAVA